MKNTIYFFIQNGIYINKIDLFCASNNSDGKPSASNLFNSTVLKSRLNYSRDNTLP